jgi:nucleoid-associated protein YgaU
MTDPNTESAEILERANLYRMKAILETMLVTVEQTKGTANAPTLTVNNDNLYRLAAIYYGDASQWTIIADANNLIDPEIYGTKTLIIPTWDGNDRGGEFGA